MKLNPKKKRVFESQTWPKDRGLDLRPNLVSIKGEQTVEREREEEKPSKKVWIFLYGFYDFWYGIVWIFGFCMRIRIN